MRGRHDRISLLGVTYVSLLMNLCFEGINTTACSDQTRLDNLFHVKPMCISGGALANTRVVLDTWDTGGPDVYSCTCTVTLDTGSAPPTATTTVTVQEYPGTEPNSSCGSKLKITSTTSSSFTATGCIPIPANPLNNFGKEDTLTLTKSRTDVTTSWQSGHCILISSDVVRFEVVVTCSNATQRSPTTKSISTSVKLSTITTTTLTKIPTTTTTTTTTLKSSTTTTPTPTQPPTVSSTGDNAAVESTTAGEQTGSGAYTDDTEIGIIAGAAGGGGLLLIIIIVVIVIIIRKKSPGNKQPFDPGNQNHGNTNGALSDDIPPYPTIASNNRYPNNDEDTRTFHNSLYVSVGLRNPGTNHIIAGTGDMYAQVQKPEKRSTVDATVATEKLELEEQTQGDVYAVVNKPEKQNENDETDDNKPSRYKHPDGLVYAEVSVQDITSRVTSCPPSVSPKPKADIENAMYAEVNTGV